MNGVHGMKGYAQLRVELEPEQIRERNWLKKHMAEGALVRTMRLLDVTWTHVQVREFKLPMRFP